MGSEPGREEAELGAWGGAPAPPPLGFTDAVRRGLERYTTFGGRASRREFWWFFLFVFAVSFLAPRVLALVGFAPDTAGLLTFMLWLGLLAPHLAVGTRRLHDTGRSGLWWLIGLVPFGGIVLLVFWASPGHPAANRYGPPPER